MTDRLIRPYQNLDRLYESAADAFCDVVNRTLEGSKVVRVSLSGGSTPKQLYALLSTRDLPWDKIHWFWGDERNVALDDADSNASMVHEALLDRVAVPRANIHAVPVAVDDPSSTAISYEKTPQWSGELARRTIGVLWGVKPGGHYPALARFCFRNPSI